MRVSSGKTSRKSKKRWFRAAKGNYSGRRKLLRTVKETVIRARAYATRDRRTRKRDFRRLWIIRLSAACAERGLRYSTFIHGLQLANSDQPQVAERTGDSRAGGVRRDRRRPFRGGSKA